MIAMTASVFASLPPSYRQIVDCIPANQAPTCVALMRLDGYDAFFSADAAMQYFNAGRRSVNELQTIGEPGVNPMMDSLRKLLPINARYGRAY